MPDVDIDFFDRDKTLKLFKHTPATIIKGDKTEKHKSGVYFHAVPEHPVTGHCLTRLQEGRRQGLLQDRLSECEHIQGSQIRTGTG